MSCEKILLGFWSETLELLATGKELSRKIVGGSTQIDLTKLRGQCYDGASNVQGVTKGATARISRAYLRVLSWNLCCALGLRPWRVRCSTGTTSLHHFMQPLQAFQKRATHYKLIPKPAVNWMGH
eukprot:scpid108880/ scgid16960/ 